MPFRRKDNSHKYQGQEMDNIIMSVVYNQINKFSDDPDLLNVAIFRVKKRFCLVVSGVELGNAGNISEFVDYTRYVSIYSAHLDFLIVNHITKIAVLSNIMDGYNFHKDGTEQHQYDLMKNYVLEAYSLLWLRLITTDSSEKDKITDK